MIRLCLYIASDSPRGKRSIEQLEEFQRHFDGQMTFEVVDILKDRTKAIQLGVIAVPTLIKVEPHPQRRVIGDLGDSKKILIGLGLEQ